MPTRATLIAGTWVSGAVLAASGVATALQALGDHAYPSVHVMSQAQVRDQLAARPGATVTVTPPGRPTVDSPGHTPMPSSAAPSPRSAGKAPQPAARGFQGGTVFASCSGDEATVTQRIPAQGYWIDRVWPGPSTAAGVRFTSPTQDELVIITCSGGQPAFASRPELPGGDEHSGPGLGGGPGGPGRDRRPGVPPGPGGGGTGGPGRDGRPGMPQRPGGGGFGGPGGTSSGDHGGPGGTSSAHHGRPGGAGGGQGGIRTAPGFGTAPGPGGTGQRGIRTGRASGQRGTRAAPGFVTAPSLGSGWLGMGTVTGAP
jgi:translation initiation factor IF-2